MKDRCGNGTPGMEQQSEQDICAREVSNAECSSQGIRNVKVRGGSKNNNNNKKFCRSKIKEKMYSITEELQIIYIVQSREKQTCDLQKESPAFPFPQLPKFILV